MANPCGVCAEEVQPPRRLYCSDPCKAEAVRRSDNARRPKKPCAGCGGEKPSEGGRKYCPACADQRRPVWERESARRKNERRAEERAAEGRTRRWRKDYPEGQAWCARCSQYLPIADFPARDRPRYCTDCEANYAHEYRLRTVYGMTVNEYDALLEIQGGSCAVCQSVPRTRRLAVDHNHKTGEIRGLLCTRCNHKVIGAAHERSDILRRAAAYLDDPPARVRSVAHLEAAA